MTLLIVPIFLSTHYISAVIHVYKLQYTTNLLSHSVNKSTALFSVVLKPVLVSTTYLYRYRRNIFILFDWQRFKSLRYITVILLLLQHGKEFKSFSHLLWVGYHIVT